MQAASTLVILHNENPDANIINAPSVIKSHNCLHKGTQIHNEENFGHEKKKEFEFEFGP